MSDESELDEDVADEIITSTYALEEPKPASWFAAEFDLSESEARQYLEKWAETDHLTCGRGSDQTSFYGHSASFPMELVTSVLQEEDISEQKTPSWFVEKSEEHESIMSDKFEELPDDVDFPDPHQSSVSTDRPGESEALMHGALQSLIPTGYVKQYTRGGEDYFAPPHVDAQSDTIKLHETQHNEQKLVFSDGSADYVDLTESDRCTVARPHDKSTIAVFVDDELSFTIDEDADERLSEFAISDAGFIAYHSGAHRQQVFTIRTFVGDMLLEEEVEVARSPTVTPDGKYVAFWKLTDHTVRCYGITEQTELGHFDTETFRKTNIGVEGTTRNGDSFFAIFDTYGPGENELLGYISTAGELIETADGFAADVNAEYDGPSDSKILDDIMSEFDQH